jgi:hypothetical protein
MGAGHGADSPGYIEEGGPQGEMGLTVGLLIFRTWFRIRSSESRANHGLENFGFLSIPMERMVGTWGLEPQTSTVSILRDLTFQRLTRLAGAAKSLEGVTRTSRCG